MGLEINARAARDAANRLATAGSDLATQMAELLGQIEGMEDARPWSDDQYGQTFQQQFDDAGGDEWNGQLSQAGRDVGDSVETLGDDIRYAVGQFEGQDADNAAQINSLVGEDAVQDTGVTSDQAAGGGGVPLASPDGGTFARRASWQARSVPTESGTDERRMFRHASTPLAARQMLRHANFAHRMLRGGANQVVPADGTPPNRVHDGTDDGRAEDNMLRRAGFRAQSVEPAPVAEPDQAESHRQAESDDLPVRRSGFRAESVDVTAGEPSPGELPVRQAGFQSVPVEPAVAPAEFSSGELPVRQAGFESVPVELAGRELPRVDGSIPTAPVFQEQAIDAAVTGPTESSSPEAMFHAAGDAPATEQIADLSDDLPRADLERSPGG